MPLNPLLVTKASLTTHILHKKYWIHIFGAYVGSLTQSKLQSTISSPKERVSKHCKIHQVQNQSSAPRHWASGCESFSAPRTSSNGGKWYIPFTAFAGLSPASSWQKMSTESYKITLNLFTKQLSHCNCKTIKDTAKEQQGFHIYATPETFLWAAKSAAASKYAHTLPRLGKLQPGLGRWNGAQNPAAPKGLWWDLSRSNSALVCAKY